MQYVYVGTHSMRYVVHHVLSTLCAMCVAVAPSWDVSIWDIPVVLPHPTVPAPAHAELQPTPNQNPAKNHDNPRANR